MDIVETLYRDTTDLDNFLMQNNELSLRVFVDANFRKSLLLASASHFERVITNLILQCATCKTNDQRIVHFIKNKALSRQYHALFDWEAKNCNSFLSLFGDDFKSSFGAKVSNSTQLGQAVKDFIEIGRERNRLVHQDYATYTLEKTAEEIFKLHNSAKYFVLSLQQDLSN